MKTNYKSNMWLLIKVVFLLYSGLTVREFITPEAIAESNITWSVALVFVGIILPFTSIGSFFAIRVSKTKRGPCWNANPFTSFIDFFHLGAWACLAGGIGAIIYWLAIFPSAGPVAVTYFAFGAAAVVGIKTGTYFHKRSISREQ